MTISKFYIDNLNSIQDIELCQSSKFHSDSNILPTHIHFVPCQWALPFLRYGYNKTLPPSKPNVKGIGEVKVQHRIVGPTSYRMPFLSVHTNRASYSWDMVILKLTLKMQYQGHGWRSPLCQFARARTIDESDVTLPVPRVLVTSQINSESVTMLSQKRPSLVTRGNELSIIFGAKWCVQGIN